MVAEKIRMPFSDQIFNIVVGVGIIVLYLLLMYILIKGNKSTLINIVHLVLAILILISLFQKNSVIMAILYFILIVVIYLIVLSVLFWLWKINIIKKISTCFKYFISIFFPMFYRNLKYKDICW